MVNPTKINGLLENLEASLKQLHEIARTEREAFLKDGVKIGGAKYYRDVFTVLNENAILPADFTLTMRQMAGLRNLLVHLYWEVDDEQIYNDLQHHLGDFDTYVQHILEFVKRQSAGQ